jgi:hypothetical protein
MAGETCHRKFQATCPTEEEIMQGDIKRALAWGFGLGIGFAVAGMALGLFKRVR